MFKLMVLSVLVAVAAAKPHEIVASLIGEKTIESHGNSVVHSSAPLIAAAPAATLISSPIIAKAPIAYASSPASYAAPAALIREKTVESHGNSIVHSSAPLLASAHIAEPAPLIYASYASPAALIGEKTVTNYGHSVLHHGGPAIAHQAAYVAPSYTIW